MQCDIMWIARSLIMRVVQLQFVLKTNKPAGEKRKQPGQESWGVKVEQVLERLAEQQEDPEVQEKTTARLGDSQQQPMEVNLHFEGK